MQAQLIIESLERVVDRVGDPTALVYERLFAVQPEMRALFAMDDDNAVKGNMLAQLIDGMIDLAGEGHYARGLIQTEMINHGNIGVPPDVFVTFVDTVVAAFREVLGEEWTPAFECAWGELAREFSAMLQSEMA